MQDAAKITCFIVNSNAKLQCHLTVAQYRITTNETTSIQHHSLTWQ